MVPRYVDISHFRAPYKESVLFGLGYDLPPGTPVTISPDGTRTWNKDASDKILDLLYKSCVMATPNDDAVSADSASNCMTMPGAMNGKDWVIKKAKEKKTILADVKAYAGTMTGNMSGASFAAMSDPQAIVSGSALVPVLVTPGQVDTGKLWGMPRWAVYAGGGVALLGVIWYVTKK